MIVDSSAIVAILHKEPEALAFMQAIKNALDCRMSAATFFETAIVIDSQFDPILSRNLDEFIAESEIVIEPVSVEQARIARNAYRDFGKVSGHPAKLNFGDCFAYALATAMREPLLYKGNDFVHTDIRSALD
jgi:ribonuclease VapC